MPTVVISETNGTTGTPTQTSNITNTNMGSVASANLDPTANPITPGTNSFEKYQRFEVTAMGTSVRVDNFRVWRDSSPALPTGGTHLGNMTTGTPANATFATPVATTSTIATTAVPTAQPGSANVSGSLTATGFSGYFVTQIQTTGSIANGVTVNMNYSYDATL